MTEDLEKYFDRLWPICRSISGNGLRQSFQILQELIPLELKEYESGQEVFDWTVPKEWNIKDAHILGPDGKKYADFQTNNLHVVNYSIPVDAEMDWNELSSHLHTLTDIPDAIPYITSYYKEKWGFCVSQNVYDSMPREGKYKVIIDSTLGDGSVTVGQCLLEGESDREILFSSYLCHPSMANNELSGPLAMAFLYKKLEQMEQRKFSYRFVLAPETIGILCFLSDWGQHLADHLDAGYVMTCCGDRGMFNYKRSKDANSIVNRAAEHILEFEYSQFGVRDFSVGGSDERQYCSPGFNLPVGSIMRTPYQEYPEYHTSHDDKSLMDFENLSETVELSFKVCQALELNENPKGTVLYGEPQLGKRGLYPDSINPADNRVELHRKMHLLSFADGDTEMLEIAERRGESVLNYKDLLNEMRQAGMIE